MKIPALVLMAALAVLYFSWPAFDVSVASPRSRGAGAEPQHDTAAIAKKAPSTAAERVHASSGADSDGAAPADPAPTQPMSDMDRAKEFLISYRDDPIPREKGLRNEDDADSVLRNPTLNPEGKELDPAGRRALADLCQRLNQEAYDLGQVWRQTHGDAAMRAMDRGQFVVDVLGDGALSNTKVVAGLKDRLSTRMGRELIDWRCAEVWWYEDGVGKILLAYYTSAQEPDAFGAAGSVMGHQSERNRALREFFATR